MNLYHARYFVDAVKESSVSRSAVKHRVNHSTVSQAIRSLEQHLGVELLRHGKRRFEITPAGEALYNELLRLLTRVEDLEARVRESEKIATGELRFCAPHSLYVRTLYQSLKTYRSLYPRVHLQLQTGAAEVVRNAVASGDAQLGITVDDGHLEGFESEKLRSGDFWLVSKGAKEKLGARDLIVTSKEKVEVEHLRRRLTAEAKERWSKTIEVVSWGVIKSLVEHGLGHGYVADYVVEDEVRRKRLHIVDVPGRTYRYEIRAIWLKGRDPHPNARRLLELLRQSQT